MFNRKVNSDPLLDEAIERLHEELKTISASEEDYPNMVDQLTKLYKLKPKQPEPMSNDTLAIVTANLVGILLIVGHERANVVTSKALGFVLKLR